MERSGSGSNWRSQPAKVGAATRECFSRVEGKSVFVSGVGNRFRLAAMKSRQEFPQKFPLAQCLTCAFNAGMFRKRRM
jgi:hypothetical protein